MENIEDNMENMKDDIENSCTSSRCPECVYELGEKIAIWCDIIHELSHSRVAMKQEIEKEFSREREDRWKARLAELATKPFSLKKSQNMLTSKQLDYSKQLTQLLEAKDVEMETNDNSTLYNL
ncbi:8526_t:CDS:2 [Rhizophagus irregularis]|nr:8526_t:CDS:2 [Rhizophagus irregularis]